MKRIFAFIPIVVLVYLPLFHGLPAWADHISEAEIEQFVRARIDMGESMKHFFKNRKPPQFGSGGGPSMEELRKLETEINQHISTILSKYDLTIESYRGRSSEVFEDDESIQAFLATRPELRKRYQAIPKSRGRDGYGH
jgi:hypothetical protein